MTDFQTRCYLVYTLSPAGWNAKKTNDSLNQWVGKKELGLCFYHEHFMQKPFGGVAFFLVESEEQLSKIRQDLADPNSELYGWNTTVHPLVYTDSFDRFFFQIEYTLKRYRDMEVSISRQGTL
jgi:hypothetical protein